MRPRSQTDFSGVGLRPRRHLAVTNGVRTEQQRKFPLFSLILLLTLLLFALSSGLKAAAGAGRRGQHLPGGSAPPEAPQARGSSPPSLPCAEPGVAFPSGARRKGSSDPEHSKGCQSSAAAGSSPPPVLCHLARGHRRPSACARTRGHPRGTVGQAGTGTELGSARPGPGPGSGHTSRPAERWGWGTSPLHRDGWPRPSAATLGTGRAPAGLSHSTAAIRGLLGCLS